MIDTVHRLRARLDRLPSAPVLLGLGFAVQIVLALVLFAAAYAGGDRVAVLVAATLLVIVVGVGLAALPAGVLLWRGRYPRLAAGLAAFVGLATLLFNEGHPTLWPCSFALLAVPVRVWAARIDPATLLAYDPGRFERVDPPADE